ncbi:3-hydroxy-3-methylglutaryl-CoA reductase [Lapidilactobacillus gannanensis]|jgi:hydroxymethylglutaryl-CoA reductase|uniref:3-hydroxy-3-methylglutaryl-CoA reductase n=1 Tax=Lapidilactobacillus gannanensis TaxID=2486002 RepID=A0ABW4BL30_9LACO|nr:3-hydroxy-3-methylglutaryl-CoA reductase [Lapidilactobacillus gannanensis]MCH4056686.1 3-hydroxy-3-methylglutaryl-CoA reductase [Lactobacillaceae bacterium]
MTKFYELSRQERLQSLVKAGYLAAASADFLQAKPALADEILTAITENDVGQFVLPYGVGANFLIDNQPYYVPMVTEEPSVIAAASNGAQRIAQGGGFQTVVVNHLILAQVILTGVTQFTDLRLRLQAVDRQIFQVAATAHPSMVKRGGGLRSWQVTAVGADQAKISLWLDPQAAFGANFANTVAEAVGNFVQTQVLQGAEQVLAAILSNSGAKMTVTIRAEVPWRALATTTNSGTTVAARIAQLNQFAQQDPERASTENKGILNGVFAAALATGNDLRAISAATTAWLIEHQQLVLSRWQNLSAKQVLQGELTLPLPIGQVGGAINSLPTATISHELLGHPTVEQLMCIIASVGLANNLAALRSLVTTGIQAGHMRLQAANLAILAGATPVEIEPLTILLNQEQQVDLARAQLILKQLRQQKR